MRRVVPLAGLALLLLAAAPAGSASGGDGGPAPVRAVGSVELPDAAGDMLPIHSSGGDEPPLDVVKLALRSDGSRLHVAATLKDPPGKFASSVVRLYLDTDGNADTGAEVAFGKHRGFEYQVELMLCMDYTGGSSACMGGATNAKVLRRWGAVAVGRFKGKEQFDLQDVVDPMGFMGKKASVKVPATGNVVEASVEYADLKVKPGQTVRIFARENGGTPRDDGDFPYVLLTLK